MAGSVLQAASMFAIATCLRRGNDWAAQIEEPGVKIPMVGDVCVGASLSSAGNCGKMEAIDMDYKGHTVQLYCYDSKGNPHGTKAEHGQPGVCYVPRFKRCNEEKECRPGTGCQWDYYEETHRCHPHIVDKDFEGSDREKTFTLSVSVMGLVMFLKSSLSKSLAGDVDTRSSSVWDARTGVYSPFLPSPCLANSMLDMVSSFFAASQQSLDGSGSLFFFSEEKQFIAKAIRDREYDVLVNELMEPLAVVSGNGNDPLCEKELSPNAWAEAVSNITLLGMPLLAYQSKEHKWVIMAASGTVQSLAAARDTEETFPWGAPQYYRVKPYGSESQQRRSFMVDLSSWGIKPWGLESSQPLVQWKRLHALVAHDLQLLALGGNKNEKPLGDYSFMFAVYRPNAAIVDVGPGCVAASPCFNSEVSKCVVLCVSIIDYLTRSGKGGYVESAAKGSKVSEYGERMSVLFQCLPIASDSAETGDNVTTELVRHVHFVDDDRRPQHVLMSIHVDVDTVNQDNPHVCSPYWEMACGDIQATQYEKTDCATKEGTCNRLTCRFDLLRNRAEYCLPWLRSVCTARLRDMRAPIPNDPYGPAGW